MWIFLSRFNSQSIQRPPNFFSSTIKSNSDQQTSNCNHSQEHNEDQPALVQPPIESIIIIAKSIYPIIIAHFPSDAGVKSVKGGYFGHGVGWREDYCTAFARGGHVGYGTFIFDWAE